MPRHSHQDAVDEPTFNRLLRATDKLRHPFDIEAYAILIFAGRLGMRAGEITHISESWVDWDRSMIQIPTHDECRCGYCQSQARQSMEPNGYTFEEAISRRWEPKTRASVRSIPFDFNRQIESTVEAFFDEFDEYPHSRPSINRRVDRVAEAAGIPKASVYPHSLRATAATHHAYRGLPAPALQSLFGWSDLTTAQKYLRLSGGATADALQTIYSDE